MGSPPLSSLSPLFRFILPLDSFFAAVSFAIEFVGMHNLSQTNYAKTLRTTEPKREKKDERVVVSKTKLVAVSLPSRLLL